MSTLKAFSDKERAYHAYQARQNYLRIQRGIQRDFEELHGKMEQERSAKEQALVAKEQALAAQEQERSAKEQALAAQAQERAAKNHALAEIERLKGLIEKDRDKASGH